MLSSSDEPLSPEDEDLVRAVLDYQQEQSLLAFWGNVGRTILDSIAWWRLRISALTVRSRKR